MSPNGLRVETAITTGSSRISNDDRYSTGDPPSVDPIADTHARGVVVVNTVALALAVVASVLMLGGALVMTSGNFGVAGALFLAASIVIYLRERRV